MNSSQTKAVLRTLVLPRQGFLSQWKIYPLPQKNLRQTTKQKPKKPQPLQKQTKNPHATKIPPKTQANKQTKNHPKPSTQNPQKPRKPNRKRLETLGRKGGALRLLHPLLKALCCLQGWVLSLKCDQNKRMFY